MSSKQVIFKLDDEEYGFNVMAINSIEEYSDIVRIPNAPANILGIINLRGDIIPVYSLRVKFGLSAKKASINTRIIIVNSKGLLVAFEVDCVNEIIEMSDDNVNEAPSIAMTINTEYVDKVAKVNGRMIILLNIDRLIDDSEKENIESFIKNQ